MKPSRLARRFNKKGRQETGNTVEEQNSLSQVVLESETTTADNQSILPSKKVKRPKQNLPQAQRKKLSKKERKRLEKILQVKKKKARVRSSSMEFFVFSSMVNEDILARRSAQSIEWSSNQFGWISLVPFDQTDWKQNEKVKLIDFRRFVPWRRCSSV